MSVFNVFKANLLENRMGHSALDITISAILAFCLGLFIFWIYKRTYSGVMYSAGFGLSLIALLMTTDLVLLTVTGNPVLSVGLVGVLAVVCFRTAIRTPLDIAFLFWTVSSGVLLSAGMVLLAMVGGAAVGVLLLAFVNHKSRRSPYIAVVSCDGQIAAQNATDFLAAATDACVVKSRSVSKEGMELNYEVRLRDGDSTFVNGLCHIDGVNSVMLVSYNGEYTG